MPRLGFLFKRERRALLDSETLDRELGYLRRLFGPANPAYER